MATVAERIKFVRKHFRLNQVDFASIIGISQTHISKIESGKDNASNKVLLAICSEFGINLDWLKDGIGVMQSQEEMHSSPNEIALRIKTYLINSSPIESDLCGMFLQNVPELFQCGSKRPEKYRNDIVLQISDLLENIFKLNKCLDEATMLIANTDDIEGNVDGVFWLKENYEKRILQNVENLLNLYLGSGA